MAIRVNPVPISPTLHFLLNFQPIFPTMNNFRDYLKKSNILISHYRSILAHAEYVYFASDSASCGAGGFLRDAAISSAILKSTPVIMVSPGLEKLCQRFKCDTPENLHNEVDFIPGTDCIPVIDSMVRNRLFDLYLSLCRSTHKSVSLRSLHIMRSPDSVWGETGHLERQYEEPWDNISEHRAIQLAVYRKHRECSQIVISQDTAFLQTLRDLCKVGVKGAPNSDGLITLSINDEGYLYDPFDAAESEDYLLARISRKKLTALVQLQPAYIDDSALRHSQAEEMLKNIKPGLVQAGKPLVVLANKNEPLALSEMLIARAQEEPPTVRFSWLREDLGKTEAIIETLLAETASLPADSRISLITDRVARAEKIQQQLAGTGVLVEIYSVNKHGYLSNRDKTKSVLSASSSPALSTAKSKQQIKQAVKSGDIQDALALASNKDALKNGIITCLCEKQSDTLEQLLKQADRIQSSIITWWIMEYKQFSSPSFLLENSKFYDLLVLALSKCNFFVQQAEKWVDKLHDLEDMPTAAKVELSFIISLIKGAIERAGITGAARIRRSDIPKELPRTELGESDMLRTKINELSQKKELLLREIEKLTAESVDMDNQINKLQAELFLKNPIKHFQSHQF